MRVGSLQRQRKSSILPVIGGCLAVYAVCAVGFHALVEPSLGKNQPPPAPVLQYSAAALAARAEAVMPPVAANRPAPAGAAARPTASKVNAKVAPAATPAPTAAPVQAAAPTQAVAATAAPAPAATPAVAPSAAPAVTLTPSATAALTPEAASTVAAAATPEATADTVEKTAAVEPKKPARKRVAAPKPQPSFFDFFSGGFNNNNYGRANNARANTARSTGPRSFF